MLFNKPSAWLDWPARSPDLKHLQDYLKTMSQALKTRASPCSLTPKSGGKTPGSGGCFTVGADGCSCIWNDMFNCNIRS